MSIYENICIYIYIGDDSDGANDFNVPLYSFINDIFTFLEVLFLYIHTYAYTHIHIQMGKMTHSS
jgi:hypothetical protein